MTVCAFFCPVTRTSQTPLQHVTVLKQRILSKKTSSNPINREKRWFFSSWKAEISNQKSTPRWHYVFISCLYLTLKLPSFRLFGSQYEFVWWKWSYLILEVVRPKLWKTWSEFQVRLENAGGGQNSSPNWGGVCFCCCPCWLKLPYFTFFYCCIAIFHLESCSVAFSYKFWSFHCL